MADKVPFLEVIHNVDWASTPLGPIDKWPHRLHQTFSQVLADSRPIALYWGPTYTTIYNEAFSRLCGSRHPRLLGQPVTEIWPDADAGPRLIEVMRRCAASGRPSREQEWRFFVERDDPDPSHHHDRDGDAGGGEDGAGVSSHWREETYLQWSITPISEGGECLGFMNPVLETTSMRLWERRTKMLIELGEVLITARDVKSYWAKTIQELEAVTPSYDIPLAILYSVDDDPDAAASVASSFSSPSSPSPRRTPGTYESTKVCRLEGTLGVPDGHPIVPPTLSLRDSDEGLAPVFREALRVRQPSLLETRNGSLPKHLLRGLQWRGFGDPCRAAVVCPLRPTKEENVMALLVLGLNPRRPYDNDYRQYIALLNQKLTTSLASTVLLEEEARRGRNMVEQAAYDQAMLKQKLEAQTKEATESMQKFQAVAEFIPVGMCFGDFEGNITFANDAWYRITGYPGGSIVGKQGLLSCVVDEDKPNVVRAYEELKTVSSVTFEFRLKRSRTSSNGHGTYATNGTHAAAATYDGDDGNNNNNNNNESIRRNPDPASSPLAAAASPSTQTSPSFERGDLDLCSLDDLPERHLAASAKAERAADGTVIRVLTCVTDVTLHKKTAEEAVRRAQQAENLRRMAEYATVGMYDMDLDGRLLGANNVFFEMCGLPKEDLTRVEIRPWEVCVCREDYPLLREKLDAMLQEGKVQTVEVRFKTPWVAEDNAGHRVVAPRWVLVTLLPVRDPERGIISFTGCLSDVSLQKWQLEREKQRKEDALESKRQQENFIDMTSHEMRNPLSAIVHCADAITGTLSKVQELLQTPVPPPHPPPPPPSPPAAAAVPVIPPSPTKTERRWDNAHNGNDDDAEKEDAEPDPFPSALAEAQHLIDDCIDNAETIAACAQHQKRIVDDVLIMSKLEYKLVTLAPTTVNAVDVVQEALKMFEIEARRVDINLSMEIDRSYYDLNHTYLDFDPSRLKQVLINLLTNALKFTKSGPTRNVSVTMGASKTRPTDATSSVQFIPRSEDTPAAENLSGQDASDGSSSPPDDGGVVDDDHHHQTPGRRESIFLLFEVKDTGQGLTEDEKKSLFQRFVQASSRTHVKYGGSGLGLYISRRLTELQNGAIGVASMPGVGSTFAFYIEAYVPSSEAVREAEAAAAAVPRRAAAARAGHRGTAAGGRDRKRWPHAGSLAVRAAPAAGKEDGEGTSDGSKRNNGVKGSVPPTPPGPDIVGVLVVEDNLINQQITRRGLLERRFTVAVANHGLEALEMIRQSDRYLDPDKGAAVVVNGDSGMPTSATPGSDRGPAAAPPAPNKVKFPLSLILMDIEMPVQDGLTCTRRIREMEREGRIAGGRIPIIAVSANARVEQIHAARAAGCDDVLVKPYRMPELVEKMNDVAVRVACGGTGVEDDLVAGVDGDQSGGS